MNEELTPQKERFLREVEQKLLHRELDARLLEDGLIRVKWNGQPLCSVDRDGIVRFRPADITGPEVDRQLRTVISQMLSNLQKVRYSRMLWNEDVISLNKKISDILSQVQFLTQLQQAGGVAPDTFISSNNKLSEQLRRLKQEKARLLDTDSDDLADRTRDLMDALTDGPYFLDSFDAELFDALVEKIIVDSNERLRFRLKNGLELTEQIERTKR